MILWKSSPQMGTYKWYLLNIGNYLLGFSIKVGSKTRYRGNTKVECLFSIGDKKQNICLAKVFIDDK
jgi:hypothetical protein